MRLHTAKAMGVLPTHGLSRGHACVTRPRWPALSPDGGAPELQGKARRCLLHAERRHLFVVCALRKSFSKEVQ